MLFLAGVSVCAYFWLFAVLGLGWAENMPTDPETANLIRLRRLTSGEGSLSCLVPPQPTNGRWKLHQRFCDDDQDCTVPQRVMLSIGSQLVYRCDKGNKVEGNTDVYCIGVGIWSAIPSCVPIKCRNLNSVARKMTAKKYEDMEIVDDVPLNSSVAVYCRIGYRRDLGYFGSTPKCTANGTWDPRPSECTRVCGERGTDVERPKRNDAPWHASLYLSNGTRKKFICGATVLRPAIVITSAACVHDMKTKTQIDPEKVFVMSGNTFVDYDSPMHDPDIVQKTTVKSMRTTRDTHTYGNTYIYEFTILELEEPFVLSYDIRPACLDKPDSYDRYQSGKYGTLVGFGKTSSSASGRVLRTLTLPYISEFISGLFDAGSTNGSGICGSGIVFQKDNLWYLWGIMISSKDELSGNDEGTCNGFSNSHYVQLPARLGPLTTIIYELESNQINRPPIRKTTTTPSPTSTENSSSEGIFSKTEESSCLVPPQPENGKWQIYGYNCENDTKCKIPQGTRLKPGSSLTYSCAVGYIASKNTEVYCGLNGRWSPIPDCIVVQCPPLKSASTSASCSRFGREMSCEYPVPSGTRAEISCSKGYTKDTVFIANQRDTLTCTKSGEWQPQPIRCIPVCGVTTTPQSPLSFGGTPAVVGDFPWHATIYKLVHLSSGSTKQFTCGATIIHRKLLLTAAHCVYMENTKTAIDPAKLFVTTGNVFINYNSAAHDPRVVKKGEVKTVHVHMNYFGFEGNYGSDIALLELKRPFDISETLLPACLDIDGRTDRILQPGARGRVAGFGRTASAVTSGNLQTVTLPYIPYNKCRNSSDDNQIKKLINDGKFCAGYTNGTSVCDGDSGGGLVFKSSDVWFVLGIVSVDLGADFTTGTKTCDPYSYTAFTKVALYIKWIQDIIVNLEQ